ncbi:hypothetical protein SAMN05720487_105183 [Fibrobacter sp. UWT2]|uniref:hypothetical protein n=1 Tax=Fibrobacter sp. UWT2 TaxID=1896224 RepID=UPI0009159087|nr:hypothetical protein [Fibrobacter sp. UWT2]SHK89668.1 hypothetical protein SAMN05720487_105183 [Fibrobacter sp. UWT2]
MKKLLAALSILSIVACSDNSSTTSASNDGATSCNYTFECDSKIHVKNNKIYFENDSIVLSGIFLNHFLEETWSMKDFMNRLENVYWASTTLKDTLLTETQVAENEHHSSFILMPPDEDKLIKYNSTDAILPIIEQTYQSCQNDPGCYIQYQARLQNPDNDKIRDAENWLKLVSIKNDLTGESICKLANTECKKERYVTE